MIIQNMNIKEKIRWWLPVRKADFKMVTFFFSAMTNDEAGRLHDVLDSSVTCPEIDVETKHVKCNFLKTVEIDSIVAKLKNEGFQVLPEKTRIEPSSEKEWNLVSILLLIVAAYFIYRLVLGI
jgi:hypothetical protein